MLKTAITCRPQACQVHEAVYDLRRSFARLLRRGALIMRKERLSERVPSMAA